MVCKYCKKEVLDIGEWYQEQGNHFWCCQIAMREQLGVKL